MKAQRLSLRLRVISYISFFMYATSAAVPASFGASAVEPITAEQIGSYAGAGVPLTNTPRANWDSDVALADHAGIGILRMNSDVWTQVQQSSNTSTINFQPIDAMYDKLKRQGNGEILFTMPITTTTWNRDRANTLPPSQATHWPAQREGGSVCGRL